MYKETIVVFKNAIPINSDTINAILGKNPTVVLQTMKAISIFFDTVFRIDSSYTYFYPK